MKKTVLFAADIIVLYGALAAMLLIRYPTEFREQLSLHIFPFSFLFVIWLVIFYINGLFDTQNLRNNSWFYSSLLRSIGIGAALAIAFLYLSPIFGITPKTNLFLFLILFSFFALGSRYFFNRLIEKRFHKQTVIVGINPIASELARFMKNNPQLGYELKYIVDINLATFQDQNNEFAEFGIIQGLDNIEQTIRKEKISVVILSPEAYQVKEIIDIFYKSLEYGVNFYNLTGIYEKMTGRVPLDAINQIWFLENITEGTRRTYESMKRVFDIIGVFLLGIPTLLITPIIALVVRFDSPGPIFYKQQRVGQRGKVFEMFKFRTMIANDAHGGAEANTGPVWAQENDPRITRLGNFFRKTRMNELPQIWNILKGEMSFIGPRAERPEFHEKLMQEIPFYKERYLVKPGATGWAQLQKSYYASVIETKEKLQYDLYYIKNRSFILDIGIILKTLNLVLRGGGR